MKQNAPLRTFYLASSNPGKMRDFAAVTQTSASLLPLPGLEHIPAPEENARSFDGNSILKAVAYSLHAPGCIVIADDSGLEVDALDGAPGVYSARYAAVRKYPNPELLSTDELNNRCLLHAVSGMPGPLTARYRCALTAARSGLVLATAFGDVAGLILDKPRGSGGFGYDPLFFLPEQNRTMAEIDTATKLQFSHRGRALAQLLLRLP